MTEDFRRSFIIALLLSLLLIHLPMVWLLWRWQPEFVAPTKQKVVTVDLSQLRGLNQLPIVDTPKSNSQAPQKTSALGEHNVVAKQETTAIPGLGNGGVPQKTPSVKAQSQSKISQAKKNTSSQKQTTQKNSEPEKIETQTPQQLTTPTQPQSLKDVLSSLQAEQNQAKQQRNQKLFGKASTDTATFLLNAPSGGGGDYLPDYKIGGRTYVNTLARPGVGYFAELKRKFRFAWNPVPSLRGQLDQVHTPTISVVWGVSLDSSGKLVGLIPIKSSGITSYDAEAKRTIQVSAPFTAPAANLLSADGMLHMAWTFTVIF